MVSAAGPSNASRPSSPRNAPIVVSTAASTLIAAIFFLDDITGEFSAPLAIDPNPFLSAPFRERIRVDVHAFDNIAIALKRFGSSRTRAWPVRPRSFAGQICRVQAAAAPRELAQALRD
jgi:hypothetical protein